jgi:hypothetical protein
MPERLAPLLEAALEDVPEDDQNATLIGLRRAFAQTLRIRSADEALFIMSLSGRTVSDVVRVRVTHSHTHDFISWLTESSSSLCSDVEPSRR